MKKTILFYLGLILCTSLFISCSDDNDDPTLPYIVTPKADVEFKGASLKTVKNALQGTWWIKKNGGGEYETPVLGYMTIKDDRAIFYGNALANCYGNPVWRDIVWIESVAKDGSKMHAFYQVPDQPELSLVVAFVPYRIKDNVLYMGYDADEDPELSDLYVLVEEE